MQLPKARTTELVEQEAGAELIIYDLRTNKAFNLNETSKIIYNACAGRVTFGDLKRRHRFSDDLIHFALDELRNIGLIEGETSSHFAGLSRRDVIKRVGIGTLAALPVIAALTAPTAANAASGCPAPNSSNIPSGCPVGTPISTGASSCAGNPDSERTTICNLFFSTQCQSGSARYAIGTCSNSGGGTMYSCACN